MQIIIVNDLQEIIIEINPNDLNDVQQQLQACLAGNYTYIDFKDSEGGHHFLTLEYLKKSHITIK
jgi:hypothetical protein